MKFRFNFVISNDFIMKTNLKALLIIKRIINLNVDINEYEKIAILSLSVLNNHFIVIKTIFDEILFKIKMKLNK